MAESALLRRVVSGHTTKGLYRLLHSPTGAFSNVSVTTTCSFPRKNVRCCSNYVYNTRIENYNSSYNKNDRDHDDSRNNNHRLSDNVAEHRTSLPTSLTVATVSKSLLSSSSSSPASSSSASSPPSSQLKENLPPGPAHLCISLPSTPPSPQLLPPSQTLLHYPLSLSSSSSSLPLSSKSLPRQPPSTTSSTVLSKSWAGVLPISRFDLVSRRSCCSVMVSTASHSPAWITSIFTNRSVRTLITKSTTTATTTTTRSPSTGKNSSTTPYPLKNLPGPKGWPFLGIFPELLRKKNRGSIHKVQLKFHEKYGRMLRLNFGPYINVALADPDLVEEFMRNEGKHPNRPPYQSWVLYKNLRQKETGLMTAADHKWYKYRSAIAPRLMRPQAVSYYTDQLNTVALDLLARIRQIRKVDNTVDLLQNELYKWATESVGCVLFGTRLGCLEKTMPQNIQDLIDAVGVMFVTGHQMAIGAEIHKSLNTKIWQNHVSSSDTIYNIAQEFIDQRLAKYSNDRSEDRLPENDTSILNYLLGNNTFSMAEIYSNMAELFLAGLDTASNSLGFAIYLLASNPHVQQKLYEEISCKLQGQPCQSSHLSNMPYLKAVVKESMRLYPVIPIGARITTEDMVLAGYHIPKGTCLMINNYAMSRDEKNFPNANEFIPERWFRNDARKFHPFAVIPFGHGSRSCIGRRIAELELYLAITHLCQNFRLKVEDVFEIEPFLRTVLTVGNKFPIQFIER
ncbi:cytochrome P450 27C1-like [Argonauta hians]